MLRYTICISPMASERPEEEPPTDVDLVPALDFVLGRGDVAPGIEVATRDLRLGERRTAAPSRSSSAVFGAVRVAFGAFS